MKVDKDLINIFDYIFLRVHDFFAEKNDISPETRGALILSLLQFLVVLDITLIIRSFYPLPLSAQVLTFVVAVPSVFINRYHYEKIDVLKLRRKWENETPSKRALNNWIIGVCLAVLSLIPIVLGIAG